MLFSVSRLELSYSRLELSYSRIIRLFVWGFCVNAFVVFAFTRLTFAYMRLHYSFIRLGLSRARRWPTDHRSVQATHAIRHSQSCCHT